MSATQTQVGGSHYKDMKIQPVDYIHANGLGFIEGSVIKYVSRHKSKGGKQDLEKAKHFLELLIEREYPNEITVEKLDVETPVYRMLKDGDTFKDGDEYFNNSQGRWLKTLSYYWQNKVKFYSGTYCPHRRPIKKDSK